MQGIKVRPRDIPMKIMGHEVKGVAIGQKLGKTLCNFLAIGIANTNVNAGGGWFFTGHNESLLLVDY
jgi:hypothetical protein